MTEIWGIGRGLNTITFVLLGPPKSLMVEELHVSIRQMASMCGEVSGVLGFCSLDFRKVFCLPKIIFGSDCSVLQCTCICGRITVSASFEKI